MCRSLYVFVLFLCMCLVLPNLAQSSCIGCINLDELNFEKTIARFPYAIVKFDIAFPYGDKHEAYAEFSRTVHKITDELLVATVGIKDYGEMENKVLGERYQVDDKNFPGIYLFKGDAHNYVQLPSHLDVTLVNLQKFVTEHTSLYIGLEGCLKEFDRLAKGYANLTPQQQQQTIEKAEQLAAALKEKQQQADAQAYLTFMRKINERGYSFVEQETKRLNKLKSGKVTEAKRAELARKLNVLGTFRVPKLTREDL